MNTTVIVILIICATIIALVAIICDHLCENKKTDCLDSALSKKIIKVHRNYIAGILGFAVIMLITSNYGGPANTIFTYLSFGSTITSLVLSILAIFVTVQSSSDLYKQFTRIDNATDTIRNLSNQIGNTLKGISESEQNLANTSKNITELMEQIVSKVIEKTKEQLQATEHNISEQISSMYVQASTAIKEHSTDSSDKQFSLDDLRINYLNSISGTGTVALYACTLSAKHNKAFSINDLLKPFENYSYGFLISTTSLSFIQASIDDKLTVTCHKSDFTTQDLITRLTNMVGKFGLDFLNQINIVNRYFGEEDLIIYPNDQKK